jgi:hypothetical protein
MLVIIALRLIRYFFDLPHIAVSHYSDCILVVAGTVPFIRLLLILFLVCNTEATHRGPVRPI